MLGKDSGHLKQRADVDVPLAADDITVAQVLKQSGYHTGLIGEWDLGGDGTSGAPWNKGFDEFAGYFDPPTRKIIMPTIVWRHDPKAHLDGQGIALSQRRRQKWPIHSRPFYTMPR
jgi:arylsulfatase A-like enzyme